MIKINLDKAKEIQKDKMREVRKPLLEKLDVDFVRALETGDSAQVAAVSAEKQALRDVTKIVDDVTPTSTDVFEITAELKQVWDETLLGENPLTKEPS
jgi:hypothetical protein